MQRFEAAGLSWLSVDVSDADAGTSASAAVRAKARRRARLRCSAQRTQAQRVTLRLQDEDIAAEPGGRRFPRVCEVIADRTMSFPASARQIPWRSLAGTARLPWQ